MVGMAETQFDLKFRLLGVPVRIHPFFWVVAAVMGWQPNNLPVVVALGALRVRVDSRARVRPCPDVEGVRLHGFDRSVGNGRSLLQPGRATDTSRAVGGGARRAGGGVLALRTGHASGNAVLRDHAAANTFAGGRVARRVLGPTVPAKFAIKIALTLGQAGPRCYHSECLSSPGLHQSLLGLAESAADLAAGRRAGGPGFAVALRSPAWPALEPYPFTSGRGHPCRRGVSAHRRTCSSRCSSAILRSSIIRCCRRSTRLTRWVFIKKTSGGGGRDASRANRPSRCGEQRNRPGRDRGIAIDPMLWVRSPLSFGASNHNHVRSGRGAVPGAAGLAIIHPFSRDRGLFRKPPCLHEKCERGNRGSHRARSVGRPSKTWSAKPASRGSSSCSPSGRTTRRSSRAGFRCFRCDLTWCFRRPSCRWS